MSKSTFTADPGYIYSAKMSASDVLHFLRSQQETGSLMAALVIVDPVRQLAVLATRSHTRGAAFVTTGWSNHMLLLPVGRWKMMTSGLGIQIATETVHRGVGVPQIPRSALRVPKSAVRVHI